MTPQEIINKIKNIAETTGIRRVPYLLNKEKATMYFNKIANAMLIWKGQTFEDTENSAVSKLLDWLIASGEDSNNLSYVKGILLKGRCGVGKTFLMQVFQKFLEIDNPYYLSSGNKTPLKLTIASANKIAGECERGGYEIIDNYSQLPVLCIDDLGAEDMAQNFGNKHNVVAEIIFKRNENALLTFATTNIDKLSESYDDRTISRMYDMFNIISLHSDKDFRKQS